jgi:hypothetical protein
LVGVYDATSGDPIAGAQVIDSTTGAFARTSATGAATLEFLSVGRFSLIVRQPGFADLPVSGTISPTDTIPLTIVLSRRK